MAAGLPAGGRGRALAIGITLVAMVVAWLGVAAPLLESYQAGQDALVQRRALAGRMRDLADALPALKRQAEAAQSAAGPPPAALEGATDAVAAAALQGLLEAMAAGNGVKVTSAEALPAEQAGAYRRIGLRVSLDATWPALVALLRAVQQATPRMFVDDLQLHAQPTGEKVRELPLDIALTLLAFRLPGAAAPVAPTGPVAPDAGVPPP